jgi:hypothetical protein
MSTDKVETVAHVIQIALTPVFLFSAVVTLLSVLSTRLGRVADRVDLLSGQLETAAPGQRQGLERRLVYLRRRTLLLDVSVILAALSGMLTLLAAGVLFVDGLRERTGATLLLAFGASLLLSIGALTGFLIEMMLASGGIRYEASAAKREAEAPETARGE